MKKLLMTAAVLAATMMMTSVSAQVTTCKALDNDSDNDPDNKTVVYDWSRKPHKIHRPTHKDVTADVSYDAASSFLTVSFPSNSQGGTVEVYRDGEKVAGITANGGTTFSCTLREYGVGNYTVIVYSGNTVVESKNYTVE